MSFDPGFDRFRRGPFRGSDPNAVPDLTAAMTSVGPSGFVDLVENETTKVRIDETGIHVTGGEISVANVGGTVVIDGSSDIFRIVASGTLTTASFTQPNEQTNSVAVSTNFGTLYDPANLCLLTIGDGARTVPFIVPSTLATDPNPTGILDYMEAWVEGTSTTVSTVRVRTRSWRNGGTQAARTYRYNILEQVAF